MPRSVRAFAPGRVNLIGEHTDYNEGLALPFATAMGVTVAAARRPAELIEALALDLGERDEFPLHNPPPSRGWRAFVRGAVAQLSQAGYELPGASLSISGDLPSGAGLSSSAALTVALTLALIELSDRTAPETVELARICSSVEHGWVGSRTGLLDQLASLGGRAGQALLIDFRALTLRPVPMALGEHRLVVLGSGERHAHAESGYNDRRAECERACELLGVTSLRDASLGSVAALPEPLGRRVRHVITENARVIDAVAALRGSDAAELGRLLAASHASLRDDYEVSTPAVEAAVGRLYDAGAAGARIIGGGFGGHVLGLLPPGARAPEGAVEVTPSVGARLR